MRERAVMTTDPEQETEKEKRISILRGAKFEFERTTLLSEEVPASQKWSERVWSDKKFAKILLIYPDLTFRDILNNWGS
jgi:hypothetical protein